MINIFNIIKVVCFLTFTTTNHGFASPGLYTAPGLETIYGEMEDYQKKSTDKIEKSNIEPIDFSFLTLNSGLLNAWWSSVAEYNLRSNSFPSQLQAAILGRNLDFIFLQEMWYEADFSKLSNSLGEFNSKTGKRFIPFRLNEETLRSSGLVLVMNIDRISQSGSPQFIEYEKEVGNESGASLFNLSSWINLRKAEDISGFKRGLLFQIFSIKQSTGTEIKFMIGNTHLTPTMNEWKTRSAQLKSMGNIIKNKMKKNAVHFSIIGCDLNLSPEFSDSLPQEYAGWKNSAQSYTNFYQDFQFIDTFRVIHPIQDQIGWTWDKTRNSLIQRGSSTVKDEPLQRPDFILISTSKWDSDDSDSNFLVTESELVFDANLDANSSPLSDHYGIYTRALFF